MTYDCTGSDWASFVPLIGGLFFASFAAGAWFWANTPFMSWLLYDQYPTERNASRIQLLLGYTREGMASLSLWSTRIFATFGALLFGGIGAALIVGAFQQCGGLHLPLPHSVQVGIGFRFWSPMLLFIAGALAIASIRLPRIEEERKPIFMALVGFWAFAASEAVAFGNGPNATGWGIVAIATWLAAAVGTWRWRAQR